jgi:hypothetical protein
MHFGAMTKQVGESIPMAPPTTTNRFRPPSAPTPRRDDLPIDLHAWQRAPAPVAMMMFLASGLTDGVVLTFWPHQPPAPVTCVTLFCETGTDPTSLSETWRLRFCAGTVHREVDLEPELVALSQQVDHPCCSSDLWGCSPSQTPPSACAQPRQLFGPTERPGSRRHSRPAHRR